MHVHELIHRLPGIIVEMGFVVRYGLMWKIGV
jgi:hypothetical protein